MYSVSFFQMAAVPKSMPEQLSRNLNTSMELVASNSVQNPQKLPPDPPLLDVSSKIVNPVDIHTLGL